MKTQHKTQSVFQTVFSKACGAYHRVPREYSCVIDEM